MPKRGGRQWPLKALLDTNVFMSALLSERGSPAQVVDALQAGLFDLVSSVRQISEFERAVSRPVLARYGISPSDIQALVQLLRGTSELVPSDQLLPSLLSVLRDPNDRHILGAALAGQADYLVTGDRDLLVLTGDPALGPLHIVTPAEFLALLGPIEA